MLMPRTAPASAAPTASLRPVPAASRPTRCVHCGQALDGGAVGAFCCRGCRAVHAALRDAGLDRFYSLRGERAEPAAEPNDSRIDQGLLSALEASVESAATLGPQRLQLCVQGVRCAACVWVLEQLFARLPGALHLEVSAATGRMALLVDQRFALRRYVEAVERVGYRVGARAADERASSDALLVRLGVCSALALNAMAFGAALYLGVPNGPLRSLLQDLGFGAALLSVLVGGPVFFGSAWRAARASVLHLDLPIAVGITLTTCAAIWAYLTGHGEAAYFDSLCAFIALMVAGRYLQERAVARSRAELLDDPGVGALSCRREDGAALISVPCRTLQKGAVLLIPPSELVPLAAELLDDAASCSLAWIDGESEPHAFARGATLPAGAINAGSRALRVRAAQDFADSALLELLRPSAFTHGASRHLHRFSALYVLAVLGLAVIGLLAWTLATGELARGLAVATAICVVTCPCAIGLAIPLAYELAHVKLRQRGVFVRDGSFLDRACRVRRVVFDKTGTLTCGRLRVANADAVRALAPRHARALYQLCARSVHPKSIALAELLAHDGAGYDAQVAVEELPGLGVAAELGGTRYRLGRRSWAAQHSGDDDALCFSADGELLASIATEESFRADAVHELRVLRERGYEVFILSGDDDAHVQAAAARLGLPASHALARKSPTDKARWLADHDGAHALMVGDGVNDALAVGAALCSATPAVDRPFLPARTDFYFTTPGLSAISAALLASRAVARIVQQNLRFAVAYNAVFVSVALAGLMAPWVAAIAMPLGSAFVVARTAAAIERSSHTWKP